MNDTFCPLPWNFQAIRANGDIRICCQANISKGRGVLKKEDGSAYNAGVDNLAESRNSKLIRDVRKNMLKGEWSENCRRCQREEKFGLVSRRSYERERWDLSIEQAKLLTDSSGGVDSAEGGVEYLDLRFGNLCNLKCRMCGPSDSSAWFEDWVKLTGQTHFEDTSGTVELIKSGVKFKTNAYDWHQREGFWEQLGDMIKDVKYIYMAGGEPLLIKKHYDFLNFCVEEGFSKNITLEYNTNCTQLPEKALLLWQSFKSVRIGASIDGFGSVFEYQRFPAKWKNVFINLQKLNSQPESIYTWLAYTVTAYNVLHIVDFMKWKLSESGLKNINRWKKKPIISPHIAHNPKHLNIRVLPQPVKKIVSEKFYNFNEWLIEKEFSENIVAQGQSISNSIISYMTGEDYYEKYWSEFKSYTQKLDEIRTQRVEKILPEILMYL